MSELASWGLRPECYAGIKYFLANTCKTEFVLKPSGNEATTSLRIEAEKLRRESSRFGLVA